MRLNQKNIFKFLLYYFYEGIEFYINLCVSYTIIMNSFS